MTTTKDSKFNKLTAPSYSIAEASRLVRLSPRTVSRYLRGYEYDYDYSGETLRVKQPPVVEQDNQSGTYASFLDLVDLLFVSELLNRSYSLQSIRKFLNEVRERLGSPHFGQSVFFTSPNLDLVWGETKNSPYIALGTGGQSAFPEVVRLLNDDLDFENMTGWGFASRWYPKNTGGFIVIDPEIAFGRPTLKGRGIPTNNIYDLYLGENEKIEQVKFWFGGNIPAPELEAAVEFERSLWG